MQHFIEACRRHSEAQNIEIVLDDIVVDPALHARFVNTLARMEYVGVRKLFKSRRAELLDIGGLQHMLDENVHALRLKKAATALAAAAGARVDTFSDDDTLAGSAGEDYLQALDRRAEAALADLPASQRESANYLMTTAAIEVRAQVFYPVYDRCLASHQAGFSVASITKDEDRHLDEVARALEKTLGNWRARFQPLMATEEILFTEFWEHLKKAVAVVRSG